MSPTVIKQSPIPPPEIVLCLPSPPGFNQYWRHVALPTKRGVRSATILSKEARLFKSAVRTYCLSNNIKPLDGQLALHLDWYRPRRAGDVDAPLKAVLDALQGLCYHDDKQIEELYVRRRDDKHRPRVEVAVCRAAPQTSAS